MPDYSKMTTSSPNLLTTSATSLNTSILGSSLLKSLTNIPAKSIPRITLPTLPSQPNSSPISLSIDHLVEVDGNVMDTGNIIDMIVEGCQESMKGISKYFTAQLGYV